MPPSPRLTGTCLLLALCLTALSCESTGLFRSEPPQPTKIPIQAIQVDVMAFSDSYTAILSQAADRVTRALPEYRAELHDAKLRNVQNAIIIAAGQNPVGALLDMTVMVTLQRHVMEDYWIPDRWGEAGQPLADALVMLEAEIWQLAKRALRDEQYAALQELVPRIRERFGAQVFVSAIRASDFAESRQVAVAQLRGGGSLLSLFQLDPLAGLSPAAQELAQSRLLAERAFFWAKRLPLILNWQMQDVILETLSEPETRQVVAATVRLSETSETLSTLIADFKAWVPEERAAALQQIDNLLTTQRNAALDRLAVLAAAEREAALGQAFEGLTAEREAILRTFEQEEVRLRGLLEDMRGTIDSGTTLSTSLTTAIESFERVRASFEPAPDAPPPDPDRRPFDIVDYQKTAESIGTAAADLNEVLSSLYELLNSAGWDERNTQMVAATQQATASFESLIDRSFRRGLILVGLLIMGGLAAAIAYRLITVRIGTT